MYNKSSLLRTVSNKSSLLRIVSNKSSLLRTVSNQSSLLRTVSHKIPAYPLLAGGETDVTGGHCYKSSLLRTVSNKSSLLRTVSNKSSLLRTVSNKSSLPRTVSHKIPAYPLLAGGESDVTGGHCSGKYPGLVGNGGRGAFHKGTACLSRLRDDQDVTLKTLESDKGACFLFLTNAAKKGYGKSKVLPFFALLFLVFFYKGR